jgi:excisionase family DNA binding protein
MDACRTISVPEAGEIYYGLSRNGSYDAVRRGEIPAIRVGRKLRVPVAAMEKKIGRVVDAA